MVQSLLASWSGTCFFFYFFLAKLLVRRPPDLPDLLRRHCTDVDGASDAAAFSGPKKDREMAREVKVDSYQLFAPRSRKRLNQG